MSRFQRLFTMKTARAALAMAVLLSVLLTGAGVAALPTATVSIAVIDDHGTTLMTRSLDLAALSFSLAPYVTAVTTDITPPEPSALHALVALLEAEGRDAADKAVLDAVDSAYGIYVASILGSVSPFYWTFRVDGADSWVGVFDHKLAPGESLEFVLTEYVAPPTPAPGFVHPESGLPLQGIDIDTSLSAISAGFAGTIGDWAILDMTRYGQAGQVGRDGWLAAAYTRLTARRVTTTDLELTAMVLTALGSDARSIRVDGQAMDLMARIASAADMQTYEFLFGLAAFDCAGYPDVGGAINNRASMVQGLLDARLPDGGWSWAPTEAISDTDTTAMAVSVLARYAAGNPAVADAIDAALDLLSGWQAADGTMGSSNATAMTLIALTAMGLDGQSDARFVKAGGNLLDGLFRYRTTDGRFGYKDTVYDPFGTEQAFRSLVVYRLMKNTQIPQPPYIFRASVDGLAVGTVLPGGVTIADTGENGTWRTALGLTLLASAFMAVASAPTRKGSRDEE